MPFSKHTKIPTEDFVWYTNEISKAEAEINKLTAAQKKLGNTEAYVQAEKGLSSLISKQQQLKNSGVGPLAQEWVQLYVDIYAAEQEIKNFGTGYTQWKELQSNIDSATQKLATYKNELTQLESSGEAFTSESDTQQYAQMQAALKQAESELERNRSLIDSEAIAQAKLNVLVAQEKVASAQTAAQHKAALTQLQQLIAVIKSLNLNIDLDALTKAITKQQRQRQLNFGGA